MPPRALLPALLLLAGCTSTATPQACPGDASCAERLRCASAGEAEIRENAQPQIARVEDAVADVTVVVTNSSRAAERVVMAAGGRLLLDVLLPPGSDYCGHPPIFSWSYDLPQRPTPVTVGAAEQQATLTVDARQPRHWITVMTQDDFPLHATLTDEAPAFG